ncbi:MAG: helix-turn-helix transcriptional regulator [Anaerolineae bacterium]
MSDKVLTSAQAAARLGVTPRTIQRWVAAGVFPNAFKLDPGFIKSPFIIPVEDVEAFERKRRERQAAAAEDETPQ